MTTYGYAELMRASKNYKANCERWAVKEQRGKALILRATKCFRRFARYPFLDTPTTTSIGKKPRTKVFMRLLPNSTRSARWRKRKRFHSSRCWIRLRFQRRSPAHIGAIS